MSGEWFYSRPLVRREGVPSLAEHNLIEIRKYIAIFSSPTPAQHTHHNTSSPPLFEIFSYSRGPV